MASLQNDVNKIGIPTTVFGIFDFLLHVFLFCLVYIFMAPSFSVCYWNIKIR